MTKKLDYEAFKNYLDNNKGKELGKSKWHLLDQQKVNQFAKLTNDLQPIHLNQEYAKVIGLDNTIAHGFLVLSLLSTMALEILPQLPHGTLAINYGFNKLRWIKAVSVGKNIRLKLLLAEYDSRIDKKLFITYKVRIEIEGIKRPALIADWIVLVQQI